jgi:hypothetical protein
MTDFKAGDRIQHKMNGGVRINGALDLTLAYYGDHHTIYTWKHRSDGAIGGEVHMSRPEFDAKIEKLPDFFEEGKRYVTADPDEWQIYFQARGRVAFLPKFIDTEKETDVPRTVAVGVLTLLGTDKHRWVIFSRYDWVNRGFTGST